MKTCGQFQYKDHLSSYQEYHLEDQMDVRSSYLYNRDSCCDKTMSLYWIGPLVLQCFKTYAQLWTEMTATVTV